MDLETRRFVTSKFKFENVLVAIMKSRESAELSFIALN